jgi:hypothetical protein
MARVVALSGGHTCVSGLNTVGTPELARVRISDLQLSRGEINNEVIE